MLLSYIYLVTTEEDISKLAQSALIRKFGSGKTIINEGKNFVHIKALPYIRTYNK